MPERLQSLASSLRAVELHLGASIDRLREVVSPELLAPLHEHRANLVRLAGDIDEQSRAVSAIDALVADRMNNFLMTVQTVSDLLRDVPIEHDIREHLRMTVDHGRTTVSHIRKVLAELA